MSKFCPNIIEKGIEKEKGIITEGYCGLDKRKCPYWSTQNSSGCVKLSQWKSRRLRQLK